MRTIVHTNTLRAFGNHARAARQRPARKTGGPRVAITRYARFNLRHRSIEVGARPEIGVRRRTALRKRKGNVRALPQIPRYSSTRSRSARRRSSTVGAPAEVTEIERPVPFPNYLRVEKIPRRRPAAHRCCRYAGGTRVRVERVRVRMSRVRMSSIRRPIVSVRTSGDAAAPSRSRPAGSGTISTPPHGEEPRLMKQTARRTNEFLGPDRPLSE